jgi:hypothetical protein
MQRGEWFDALNPSSESAEVRGAHAFAVRYRPERSPKPGPDLSALGSISDHCLLRLNVGTALVPATSIRINSLGRIEHLELSR